MNVERLAETLVLTEKTSNGGRRRPDSSYIPRWIAKVKANCTIQVNGCWVWQGTLASNGYGQCGYRGKTAILHRKMYELHYGVTLGRWEYACHSCDTKRCCNPEHLWKGTPKDNQVDCILKRRNSEQRVTHCPRGHEYSVENTTWKVAASGRPARECKLCTRIRSRLAMGWPLHLAISLPPSPKGHRPVAGKRTP